MISRIHLGLRLCMVLVASMIWTAASAASVSTCFGSATDALNYVMAPAGGGSVVDVYASSTSPGAIIGKYTFMIPVVANGACLAAERANFPSGPLTAITMVAGVDALHNPADFPGDPTYFRDPGSGLYFQVSNSVNAFQTLAAGVTPNPAVPGEFYPGTYLGPNWVNCPGAQAFKNCPGATVYPLDGRVSQIPITVTLRLPMAPLKAGTIPSTSILGFGLCPYPSVPPGTSGFVPCGTAYLKTPTINIHVNCQFDTDAALGQYNLGVTFPTVTDRLSPPGTQLEPDAPFQINFKNCQGSPLPKIHFDLYNSDTADPQGNFPLFSPSYGSASREYSGMGFQIIDRSDPRTRVLQSSSPYVQITDPHGVNNVYPQTVDKVTWPFAVRLIKGRKEALTVGTFEGRATFTVAYP